MSDQADDRKNEPNDRAEESLKSGNKAPDNSNSQDLEVAERKAMAALVPIIQHIKDVDADRKFDICMSAIRLTSNKGLVNTALEAALQIDDEPGRAQALVELINEINYLKQA